MKKSTILTINLMLLIFVSSNIAAPDYALGFIASEISDRLISQSGTSLLSEVLTLPSELQNLISNKLIANVLTLPSELQKLISNKLRANFLNNFHLLYHELIGHERHITTVAFSTDGNYALTGSADNTARLWDLTKKPITSIELPGHSDTVYEAAFSPNGKYALTLSRNRIVKLWNLTQYPIASQDLKGHIDWITSAFSPDNNHAITRSKDNVLLWDLTQNPVVSKSLQLQKKDEILSVEFSPDGKYILTGSKNGHAVLWDLTQKPITSQELLSDSQASSTHSKAINSIAFSSDGRYALTGSGDHTARLWDLTANPITSRELRVDEAVYKVAFSPNDQYALTGLNYTRSGFHYGKVMLWNLTHKPITSILLSDQEWLIYQALFSPDGNYILVESRNWVDSENITTLWDLTQRPFAQTKLKRNDVEKTIFSPDSKYALTQLHQKYALLWDLTERPVEFYKLIVSKGRISSIAFSPDSKYILTGSSDGTVQLWNLSALVIKKIIDYLNIPELVLINKAQDLNIENKPYEDLLNHSLFGQIIAESGYRKEFEDYFDIKDEQVPMEVEEIVSSNELVPIEVEESIFPCEKRKLPTMEEVRALRLKKFGS